MKIVFFGSSKYSTIAEEAVFKKFELALVVTFPDRSISRKKIPTPNPVKNFALKNNIPVIETEKIDKKTVEQIKKCRSDFFVVADYGLILPKELLNLPRYAPLNIHHSLLPKYRGSSPAPTVILNGEKVSGVTIIKMSKQVDAGNILVQKEYKLKKNETTDSLLIMLNTLGAEILIPVIENYYTIKLVKQDASKATFTKRMSKKDGFINIKNPPSKEKLDRMIRAYHPWPGVWTVIQMSTANKKLLTTKRLGVSGKKLEVRIKFLPEKKIQVEGKKPMSYKDFLNGYPEAKEIMLLIIKRGEVR